jgi:hypothetical protein
MDVRLRPIEDGDLDMLRRFVVEPGLVGWHTQSYALGKYWNIGGR